MDRCKDCIFKNSAFGVEGVCGVAWVRVNDGWFACQCYIGEDWTFEEVFGCTPEEYGCPRAVRTYP
jgi:hypothetical protein